MDLAATYSVFRTAARDLNNHADTLNRAGNPEAAETLRSMANIATVEAQKVCPVSNMHGATRCMLCGHDNAAWNLSTETAW